MDQTSTLTIQQAPQTPLPLPANEMVRTQNHDSVQKRKQVKIACSNCQKACKKCDESRPCVRCVKCGLTDTCADSVRKERKKGVRRGPYKRKGRQTSEEKEVNKTISTPGSQANPVATTSAATGPPMTNFAPIPGSNGAPDYGYPANLHQYNFGPYNPAIYGSDKLPQQRLPYYTPPISYAGIMPDQEELKELVRRPYPLMMYPYPPPQPSPLKESIGIEESFQQEASESKSTSCSTSPHLEDSKDPIAKPQPMTPVPSSSSSSLTSSSPDDDEDSSSIARLTRLCSAVLNQQSTRN